MHLYKTPGTLKGIGFRIGGFPRYQFGRKEAEIRVIPMLCVIQHVPLMDPFKLATAVGMIAGEAGRGRGGGTLQAKAVQSLEEPHTSWFLAGSPVHTQVAEVVRAAHAMEAVWSGGGSMDGQLRCQGRSDAVDMGPGEGLPGSNGLLQKLLRDDMVLQMREAS